MGLCGVPELDGPGISATVGPPEWTDGKLKT